MASAHAQQQIGDVDRHQAKVEPQGSGRGSGPHHSGGSEMTATASGGHGQQLSQDKDHLLTAPRVSLSPAERVSFCIHIYRSNMQLLQVFKIHKIHSFPIHRCFECNLYLYVRHTFIHKVVPLENRDLVYTCV